MIRRHAAFLLAAGLLFAGADTLSAQGISIGAKAGLSVSKFGGDDAPEDMDGRTGLIAGGLLVYRFSDAFAIQPEVLFAQKGATFTEQGVEGTLKLDYVETALLLKASFGTGGSFRPSVFAGPAFAFEAGCEIEFATGGVEGSVDCDEDDDSSDRETTDLGLAFGAGVDFPMSWGAFMVDGRYTYGMKSLDGSTENNDIKNRAWAFMAGVSIPLMGR